MRSDMSKIAKQIIIAVIFIITVSASADDRFKNYTLPVHRNSEMEDKAKRLDSEVRSDLFQQRLQAEKDRLARELGGKDGTANKGYFNSGGDVDGRDKALSGDERVYIFISSSVPIETLRNYAREIDKLREPNVLMVLRGFKDGMVKVKPTLEFISSITMKDRNCKGDKCEAYSAAINIDPMLFRKYNVNAAPAVVYARGIRLVDPDMGDCQTEESTGHFMVKGDARLSYALEVINREARSASLERLIKKLHGKYPF